MVTIPDWGRKSPDRRKEPICKSLIVSVLILGNMTPGLDIGLWRRDSDPGGASRIGLACAYLEIMRTNRKILYLCTRIIKTSHV